MVVHPDHSRDHSGAAQLHHSRSGRDAHARGRTDLGDAVPANHDRLTGFRRTAGAVDGGDVGERHHGVANRDEVPHLRRERRGALCGRHGERGTASADAIERRQCCAQQLHVGWSLDSESHHHHRRQMLGDVTV